MSNPPNPRKPTYPEENDPNDPLPIYDDGDRQPNETQQQYVARVTAARQAMNILRKKPFYIGRLTRHEGEDELAFRRRQINRQELIQQAEEDHAARIDHTNPRTFDADYARQWQIERSNRHNHNAEQRRQAWEAARRWDQDHQYDPLQRPIPTRDDDDSGDELYEREVPDPVVRQPGPTRQAQGQKMRGRNNIMGNPTPTSPQNSPLATSNANPLSTPHAAPSSSPEESARYRRCTLCAKRKRGCSASQDGLFPCNLCSQMGPEYSRLCTLENSHEVRANGRRQPPRSVAANSKEQGLGRGKTVPGARRTNLPRAASRNQPIQPAPSSQQDRSIGHTIPILSLGSGGSEEDAEPTDNENNGDADFDAMDIDDALTAPPRRPVQRSDVPNRDRPRRKPQPPDPSWYGEDPTTARCKRCEEIDLRGCGLVITGFPCNACAEADKICENGSGKYKGRGRFKVKEMPQESKKGKEKAAFKKDKGKAAANASDERRGRGDNMSMSMSRRRSGSPVRRFAPCNNCKAELRRCDGGKPCKPCFLASQHFTCSYGDTIPALGFDFDFGLGDDEKNEEDDEMAQAMAQSRQEHQQQQRFNRALGESSASASARPIPNSGADTAGGFNMLMPASPVARPPNDYTGHLQYGDILEPSITIQDQVHATTSATTGYGGVPEAPSYRAQQEMINAQHIWNPSPADFDLSDYINDESASDVRNGGDANTFFDDAMFAGGYGPASSMQAPSSFPATDDGEVDLYGASPPRQAEIAATNLRRSQVFDVRGLFEGPAGLNGMNLQSSTQSFLGEPTQRQQRVESQQLSDSVTFNYTGPEGRDHSSRAPARFLPDGFPAVRHWRDLVGVNWAQKFAPGNQCQEWANYFYKHMSNYREPPECGKGGAASCDVLIHHFDTANTCQPCHDLQNLYNLDQQNQITEATKGYVCQACAVKIRSGRLGHQGTCMCIGQLRKSWVCHMHRESGLVQIQLSNMTAKEFAIRISGEREFCLGCYVNNADPSSKTWGCYTCRDWVHA